MLAQGQVKKGKGQKGFPGGGHITCKGREVGEVDLLGNEVSPYPQNMGNKRSITRFWSCQDPDL